MYVFGVSDAALKHHFSIHFRALLQLIILQVYARVKIHGCEKSEFLFLHVHLRTDAALRKFIISEKSIGFKCNSSGLPGLAQAASLEKLINSVSGGLFYGIEVFTNDAMVIYSMFPIQRNK